MKRKSLKQQLVHPAGISFIMLISLAYLGFYVATNDHTLYELSSTELANTIDAVITDVTVQQFNHDGQRVQWLTAPAVTHIPNNNQHTIKNPHIQISNNPKQSVDLSADTAIAIHGGDKITFKQNVQLNNLPKDGTPASKITTDHLTYFPKTQHAVTTHDVFFVQDTKYGHTKGLFADLSQYRLKLLHAVTWDQDTTHLRADTATTQGDATNPLLSAVIRGTNNNPAHFWRTSNNKQPTTHARAQIMNFDNSTQILTLLGNPLLTQDDQSFAAPIIRYDIKRQHMITSPTSIARTQIIIHPRNNI